ncbi:TetR/AcrR family transcriptional regulator [uncultured Formosa sp.]|uniref:TetR/AcrR family transcriptional regulator n=1 Tax=uncultured Formosa sp. TaxID=255435 RepID=UPI00261C2E76|nr:TetR/AcrR family transcriptional regulator [uncultured Formosa sp.]
MKLNEKKIKILLTAEKLFAENGFDGTTIRKISREAKINIAMVSYYFGSKEKLLEALLIYRISDLGTEFDSIVTSKGDYFEKIDAFIEMVVKHIHKNRRTHKIVSFEYSNPFRKIDFKIYENYKKENFTILAQFIKNGQDEGVFSKDVNIQMIIPTILGTYFHLYYNKQFYKDLLGLANQTETDNYVHNQLTLHIKQTIKALLTYEK